MRSLVPVLFLLSQFIRPAIAQQATYEQVYKCTTVPAVGSKPYGYISTTDKSLLGSSAMPDRSYYDNGDGYWIRVLYTETLPERELCRYETDYTKRTITAPSTFNSLSIRKKTSGN